MLVWSKECRTVGQYCLDSGGIIICFGCPGTATERITDKARIKSCVITAFGNFRIHYRDACARSGTFVVINPICITVKVIIADNRIAIRIVLIDVIFVIFNKDIVPYCRRGGIAINPPTVAGC